MTILDSIISGLDLSSPSETILLTPSFVNPGVLKRNLALKTGKLANLKVMPFRDFIVSNAVPLLSGRSYISGDRQFWLLMDLLRSTKDTLKYFGPAIQFDGFGRILLDSLQELRLNGIEAKHFSLLSNKDKWGDICSILEKYDRLKSNETLFDYADAAVIVSGSSLQFQNTFLIDCELSGVERQLAEKGHLGIIQRPPALHQGIGLTAYKVDTPYQEVQQTVRNILDDLRTMDVPIRIGIVVPDYDSYYYHFDATLRQIQLPSLLHFAQGRPLLSTPAANLWKYFAEWLENNFSVYRLLRILECNSFDRASISGTDDKLTSSDYHAAVRHIRDAEIVLFDRDFLPAFRKYLSGRNEDKDEEREDETTLPADIALKIVEAFDSIHTSSALQDQLTTLKGLFVDHARILSDSDAATVSKMESILDGFLAAVHNLETGITIVDAVGMINERLTGLRVNSTLPDFTKPVVGTGEDLRYYEFDKLYLLGMNEKGPPPAIFQNPILLDDEKAALSQAVPMARFYRLQDRLESLDRDFNELAATAQKSMVISAPLKDLTSGREYLVSRYFLRLWNEVNRATEDYKSLSSKLATDSRSHHFVHDPAIAYHPYEMAVAGCLMHEDKNIKGMPLTGYFPLADGALKCRTHKINATTFDEYLGIVKADPKRQPPLFSASRLRKWTTCPYQYFLEYELRLNENFDYDSTSLEWLGHLERGSLLHELYYRFFIALRNSTRKQFSRITPRDESTLWGVFDQVITEYKSAYPVISPSHFESEVASLRRDVKLFFDNELKNKDQRVYVELAFAMPSKEGREPLLQHSDPVTINLGNGISIKLRGSIDRVDKASDGKYFLYDYKTGRFREPESTEPFGGGEFIQAGLYCEIISQIDPSITKPLFRFYYPTERGEGNVCEIDYSSHRPHFLKFLAAVLQQLTMGNFVPAVAYDPYNNAGTCSFCDYRNVCLEKRFDTGRHYAELSPHHNILSNIRKEVI